MELVSHAVEYFEYFVMLSFIFVSDIITPSVIGSLLIS